MSLFSVEKTPQGTAAEGPAMPLQGFAKVNPANMSMLGKMQLSHAGSRHGDLPCPQGSIPRTRPS